MLGTDGGKEVINTNYLLDVSGNAHILGDIDISGNFNLSGGVLNLPPNSIDASAIKGGAFGSTGATGATGVTGSTGAIL